MQHQLGLQQLGDTEVEQFDGAIGCDDDVARLDVAVNDKVLVRVLNGIAHAKKQRQALLQAKPLLFAVVQNWRPFNILHRQERQPILRFSAIQKASDVRMIQIGEYLPLGAEPPDQFRARKARAENLDGDFLFELIISALGQEHLTHATDADSIEDAVGADSRRQRFAVRRLRLSAKIDCGFADYPFDGAVRALRGL